MGFWQFYDNRRTDDSKNCLVSIRAHFCCLMKSGFCAQVNCRMAMGRWADDKSWRKPLRHTVRCSCLCWPAISLFCTHTHTTGAQIIVWAHVIRQRNVARRYYGGGERLCQKSHVMRQVNKSCGVGRFCFPIFVWCWQAFNVCSVCSGTSFDCQVSVCRIRHRYISDERPELV